MSNIILKKITERLDNIESDWNVLVLKKFPINIISQLQYPCLDDFAISNHKIDLSKLTYWNLFKCLGDYKVK